MTLLIKSTHTCGQTLVKDTVKPYLNPKSLNVLPNFCRVLQISPKHFKISQYESCPVFRVEKDEKLGQLPAAPVHRDLAAFKVWQQIMQKPLRKTP
jgi:hypothetical protein